MIVLDSSFLVAWYNERDAHHKAAAAAMPRVAKGAWGPALLPEYVLLETLTVLAARRDLSFAQTKAREILESKDVELVACSPYLGQTMDVFRTQSGTALSFADCAIVAISRERRAQFVAGFDEEFEEISGVTLVP